MTTMMCADDWKEIAAKAQREAAEWRQNFEALQRALVGDTGSSGITVAAALRKDAGRYRWLREREVEIRRYATVGQRASERLDDQIDAAVEEARAVGAA